MPFTPQIDVISWNIGDNVEEKVTRLFGKYDRLINPYKYDPRNRKSNTKLDRALLGFPELIVFGFQEVPSEYIVGSNTQKIMNTLIARKVGMTQIFDENSKALGVTVLDVSDCRVVQIKNNEVDGYSAAQLTIGTKKNSTKPLQNHFKKYNSVAY